MIAVIAAATKAEDGFRLLDVLPGVIGVVLGAILTAMLLAAADVRRTINKFESETTTSRSG